MKDENLKLFKLLNEQQLYNYLQISRNRLSGNVKSLLNFQALIFIQKI